jgi:hypothetical protein
MRRFQLALATALIAMSLGGCAEFAAFRQTVSNVATAIVTGKINRKAVYVAASTANGLIVTADLYLQQPICGKLPCRTPDATEPIINAKTVLSSARSSMLAFMKAHPDELGDKGLYDAMVAAGAEMRKVFATYGVGSS